MTTCTTAIFTGITKKEKQHCGHESMKYWNVVCPITLVFRWFGESAHLLERRDVLTCHDIFLMKNQSIVFLHEESDGGRSVIPTLTPRRIARGVDQATRY